jgi:hypothetical protein
MHRRPLTLLVLLAFALGIAACGGDDGGGGDSPDEILAKTFGEDKDVKSGRIDLKLRINAKGVAQLQQPVSLGVNGPFASTKPNELPRFALSADLEVGGQQLSGGAVSTGDAGFLLFQGQAFELGKDLFEQFRKGYADQAKCNENESGSVSLKSLGVDPQRWLSEAQTVGSEEVGGVNATHLTAKVDVPRLLEDVNRVLGRSDLQRDPCAEESEKQPEQPAPQQLSEEERKQIAEAVKEVKVDLWSGEDDRILRRINVQLKLSDGRRSGDLSLDFALGAVNAEQRIDAPEGARPLSELTGQLGGQLPGLGGGGAQPGTPAPEPAPAPGTPSPGAQGGGSAYDQCVQEAGADVGKLQQCAELVGQ